MLSTLIQDTKRAAEDAVKLAYIGAFVALLAAIALFFLIYAGYQWAAAIYGPVVASLALGVIFLFLAIAAYAAMRISRNARERREARRRDAMRQALSEQFALDPKWLPSPEILSTGLTIVRRLASEKRFRQLVPAALPALALGLVIVAYGAANRRKTPPVS